MTPGWKWACMLSLGAMLSGCASDMHSGAPNALASNPPVTVQCTVTGTSDSTPCIQEARQTCHTDGPRLQRILSKNVIPTTQGADQTPMPITQYTASYACN
jgi:hypothetical protein